MGELRAADPVDVGVRTVNAKAVAVLTHHVGVTPGTTTLIMAGTDEFKFGHSEGHQRVELQ